MGAAEPPRVGALVGPTAVGKSDLALALAGTISAEIINADSTAVYRCMDIGTDKPGAAARERVPHHLFDLVDPDVPFTAALYREAADRAIAEIVGRRGRPLMVGGSGLHVRAVLQGYRFPSGVPDAAERQRWNDLVAREGPEAVARILRDRAPRVAERTDMRNPRRVIRALERLAAHPPLDPRPEAGAERDNGYESLVVGLQRPRDVLYERIEARVDRELGDGLVSEVRGLLASGYPADAIAFRALGYKEIIRHLRGDYDEHTMRDILVRNTRRFARRQFTWFRSEPGIVWLDVEKRGRSALDILVRWYDAFYRSGLRPRPEESDAAP